MKKLTVFVFVIFISGFSFSQSENFKQVKIKFDDKAELENIIHSGLDIDHYSLEKDNSIVVFLSDSEFEELELLGFRYEVLIDDWYDYYSRQPVMTESEKEFVLHQIKKKRNITGFGYGSMGGFYTLQEVLDELDNMRALYPNIITAKYSIGQTIEGREMYAVKISDNPDVDEDEPEIFFNSLIHAREPAAMMALIYYMYYLVENYGVDPEVTYLVDNREIYFLPVLNVDGYEYNRIHSPNGGGMWRKNRRINSGGSIGVDLNRNYGFHWGYNNSGSSPYPDDGTYRGTGPFSEPETENVRQFCNAHHFKAALNYHTYSDLLILPWGYIPEETPDSLIFREFAADMTQYNGYTWGISDDIIYEVNGASDDWMYGEQTEKDKIISMTPEVGTSADGFWPQQSRIYPLAEENLFPNLYLTWAAGDFVTINGVTFSQQYFNPGDSFTITPKIKNKGLADASNIVVSIEPLSPLVGVTLNTIQLDALSSRTQIDDPGSFGVALNLAAPIGEELGVALYVTSNGVLMSADTVSFFVGTPRSLFEDDGQLISNNWEVSSNQSQKWSSTGEDYFSDPESFTDSKNTDYSSSIVNVMKLKNGVDLTGIANPRLTFKTKWNIESEWDCGQVEISTNNGSSWTPLEGKYTSPGSGSGEQTLGEPVYDGRKSDWVMEDIDLEPFTGNFVKIRFEFKSDTYVEYDGWYVDDVMIYYYGVVPVELNSFTALTQESSVKLEWETASEVNNLGFELQKSQDEQTWKKFAFVDGIGTSNEINNYSFEDKAPLSGVQYYRLVQIDYDGGRSISNSVEVNFTGNFKYRLGQNYPNPFNPSTVIDYVIKNDGFVSLKVYNSVGEEIASLVNEFQKGGKYSAEFDTGNLKRSLSSGIYFYTLKSGGFFQSRKMILLK